MRRFKSHCRHRHPRTTGCSMMSSSSIMNGSFTKSTQLKYSSDSDRRPRLRAGGGQEAAEDANGKCEDEKPFSTALTRPDVRNPSGKRAPGGLKSWRAGGASVVRRRTNANMKREILMGLWSGATSIGVLASGHLRHSEPIEVFLRQVFKHRSTEAIFKAIAFLRASQNVNLLSCFQRSYARGLSPCHCLWQSCSCQLAPLRH